jgi:hypothetical protein
MLLAYMEGRMPVRKAPELDPYQISLIKLSGSAEKLGIDKNDLDTEFEHQPQDYHAVADEAARTVSWVDGAKMDYENTRALTDGEVRRSMEEEEGRKPTEAQIAARVSLTPTVQTAYRIYLNWKELSGRWDALEKAYRQRASAIEGLARLYGNSYFSKSSVAVGQRTYEDREHSVNRAAASEAPDNHGHVSGRAQRVRD